MLGQNVHRLKYSHEEGKSVAEIGAFLFAQDGSTEII